MQINKASSPVRSIQRGVANINPSNISVIVSIAMVNPLKSFLTISVYPAASGVGAINDFCFVGGKIKSSTELELSRAIGSSGYNTRIEWQVIEYV